jgi:hypothetical protein
MVKKDVLIAAHMRKQMIEEHGDRDSQPFLLIMLMIWIMLTIFWNYFT